MRALSPPLLCLHSRAPAATIISIMTRKFTLIESPFNAPTEEGVIRNVSYAMLAVRDSLNRGEAPYASHLFFTQMMDDNDPEERATGIDTGLHIGSFAEQSAVYIDLGMSRGMEYGIANAERAGRDIVYRRLYEAAEDMDAIERAIRANSPLPPEAIRQVYARIIR